MRGLVVVIGLALLAGPAAGQGKIVEIIPGSGDEVGEELLISAAARLALAARTMGACERRLPEADVQRNLNLMMGWADPVNEAQSQLTGLYANWYARGRAEAATWSVERCVQQLQDDAAAISRLNALFAAQGKD